MSDIKLCKDCKHCRPDEDYMTFWRKRLTPKALKFARCVVDDYVGSEDGTWYCSTQRTSELEELCGKKGRFWEPKE